MLLHSALQISRFMSHAALKQKAFQISRPLGQDFYRRPLSNETLRMNIDNKEYSKQIRQLSCRHLCQHSSFSNRQRKCSAHISPRNHRNLATVQYSRSEHTHGSHFVPSQPINEVDNCDQEIQKNRDSTPPHPQIKKAE
jgi:hypothetical protein